VCRGRKPSKVAPAPWNFVTPPEENQAMAISNMHKIGKDRTCGSGDILADRQTHRHAHRRSHHNTSHRFRGQCKDRTKAEVAFYERATYKRNQINDKSRTKFSKYQVEPFSEQHFLKTVKLKTFRVRNSQHASSSTKTNYIAPMAAMAAKRYASRRWPFLPFPVIRRYRRPRQMIDSQ